MENNEFKKKWEKDNKKLFDLEQKKGATKAVQPATKAVAKEEPKHSFPAKRKGKEFTVVY